MNSSTQRSPWLNAAEREKERVGKRDAVLSAAVRSFNEKGFHATSLDDVAASLNITKPTIYYYFANKDEILFECVRLGLAGIKAIAEQVEAAGGSGMERLRALMRGYAVIMTKDFGMCVIRTADQELSAESRVKFRSLKHEIDIIVRHVVKNGMADGSIAEGDPLMMTFTLAGALNWIARWYEPGGKLDAEEVADFIVENLVRGLSPRQ